jgi:hypothetical protein
VVPSNDAIRVGASHRIGGNGKKAAISLAGGLLDFPFRKSVYGATPAGGWGAAPAVVAAAASFRMRW